MGFMRNYQKKGLRSWDKDRALEWSKRQEWLCGFNYVPAYAGNTTEFWQGESFDADAIAKELRWAADWGYNSARIFLQYLVWKQDRHLYKERIDTFLTTASRYGISTIPVIFDDCAAYKEEFLNKWTLDGVGIAAGDMDRELELQQFRRPTLGNQPDPVPGVHNSVWTPCPGTDIADDPDQYPRLREYEQDIIGSFGSDPRIILWDMYNEPHNAGRRELSIPLVRDSFVWAREVEPQQPLTLCVGFAYDPVDEIAVENSDIVSFHSYSPFKRMKELLAPLQAIGYPLLITEWMARSRGSTIKNLLWYFKEENIGCYQWGLVSGRTQTYFPWATQEGSQEPEIWFHDVIRQDGSPYDETEYQLVRELTGRSG